MIEKEKKFLYKGGMPMPKRTDVLYIRQGYLFVEGRQWARIREERSISGDPSKNHKSKYTLCYKYLVGEHERIEIESEVSAEHAATIMKDCKKVVHKHRHIVADPPYGARIFMDQMLDKDFKLGTVYVEYEVDDEFPEEFPDYCGEMVSGQPQHSTLAYAISREDIDG